jgi:hypothetical protein
MAKQAFTRGVTTAWIMLRPAFLRGVEDVRAGRPPTFDDPDGSSWCYERGRLFGAIAPVSMPIKIKGKLNHRAIALFDAAFDRNLII